MSTPKTFSDWSYDDQSMWLGHYDYSDEDGDLRNTHTISGCEPDYIDYCDN